MRRLAIMLMSVPYGTINAAEAVRHALGAAGEELEVSLVLADAGTLAAVRGQDAGDTGLISLEASIRDCVDMDVKVYVEKASLRGGLLDEEDLVEGVRVVNSSETSEIVGQADSVMIF